MKMSEGSEQPITHIATTFSVYNFAIEGEIIHTERQMHSWLNNTQNVAFNSVLKSLVLF